MQAEAVLQVSELTRAIKSILEQGFPRVVVEGEVSNFRPSSTGHWYFTLKDAEAAIQCVMFKGSASSAAFLPVDGDVLRVHASVSVYARRGAYQLVVRSMERAGTGRILEMLEERKRTLAAAGLFDRERALPKFPRTVAIVTSPTGAAVRDVLQVLRRRDAPLTVRIIPVPVQGAEAAPRIARAVRYASTHRLGEVIVLTRGGGSLEDLLPFSDEEVVRAVAESAVPTISAIGHEVDWALTDYAADRRAPTPSAAAEVVSAQGSEIAERIVRAGSQAVAAYLHQVRNLVLRAERCSEDEIRYRFRNLMQPWYQRLDDATQIVRDAMKRRLVTLRSTIDIAHEGIRGASPFLALERGYAMIRDEASQGIVTRAGDTRSGQRLTAQFFDGTIRVERTNDE
ncbi:MAG: exodeoxyribonuclease VII large subunit [Spirochaetales bacterium]|nr:exodeoxyribonuclease VII large subunit [Spirochaetales bacterium]